MELKSLTEAELTEQLEKLVISERKITHHILKYIAKVDRRKLYLAKAYSSLFDYLTKRFGYSPAAAMRRIDGARLLHEIPEVAEKIKDGSLQLSQVSQLQKAVRDVKKLEQRTVSVAEKRQVLAQIEQTTQKQTKKIIAETFLLPATTLNKTVVHHDESVTLTITLNKQQQELLEKVKELASHKVPGGNWAELITHLAQKELKRRLGSKKAIAAADSKNDNNSTKDTVKVKPTSVAVAPTRQMRKAIPLSVRKQLLSQQRQCGFRDLQIGRRCESRSFLQVDHIQGIDQGGGNNTENLQVLCGAHNRWKFKTATPF